MKVKIIDCDKILYQRNIISIIAPGVQGYFQILENHAHFISILKNGIIKLYSKIENIEIKIKEGILQVKNNSIIVLLF
ncbi:ATP synthase F1 subunit epsilon [Blattabacterium sp. (Blattella germanica) str. Bge]|uniref:F0F1 ATP synthase subunit epsilon n=1 Tax=Blattabacterium sp. (Blattella germanica) TaxID=624186 RepID=UPI0001BB62EB|nr:F0F1 ATP synthase subunit epsilon [Blattabacterium sp. (Blattella germanica)]ACY40107.1 ATP synthase F1 subunit epsilon [Blattabacterium sp. (Blattella germanica) str. Bge]